MFYKKWCLWNSEYWNCNRFSIYLSTFFTTIILLFTSLNLYFIIIISELIFRDNHLVFRNILWIFKGFCQILFQVYVLFLFSLHKSQRMEPKQYKTHRSDSLYLFVVSVLYHFYVITFSRLIVNRTSQVRVK